MNAATARSARKGTSPRVVNAFLGAWLVASVFLWPHDGPEGFNALVTGVLVVTAAVCAIWAPSLRYANLLFAGWLLVTTLFFRHESFATLFNNVLVSAAILVLAFVPSGPSRRPRAGRAPA